MTSHERVDRNRMAMADLVGSQREEIVEMIDAAVAEAETRCESVLRTGLGMIGDETLGQWLKRMQDTVNQQRDRAVAEEREACAMVAVGDLDSTDHRVQSEIAARIRARGKPSRRGGRDADPQQTVQ